LKKKRHLNHLFSLLAEKYMEEEDVAAELQNMILASTETTSYSLGFTFLALAMHPEIQKNVQNELDSIFGTSDRDITLEDVINMDYLERVIKESLRLFPSVPFVMRNIDKTIEIGKSCSLWRSYLLITSPTDSHVFPAGADIVVAIMNIHMRPDLWPDPWKFDPDRFLPEETEKRHRCAFMPFGHGSRVCAGECALPKKF
jgi:cytochrome P450 family 4